VKLNKPPRIVGDVCYIPLTKGYEAIIDVADLDLIGKHSWKASIRKKKDGSVAKVYAQRTIRVDGKCGIEMMHRVLCLSENQVDHENGDGLDNRRNNLRPATRRENSLNTPIPSTNTSGFKGATWAKRERLWLAQTKKNGKNIFLGYHKCAAAAHIAYTRYAMNSNPQFARAK